NDGGEGEQGETRSAHAPEDDQGRSRAARERRPPERPRARPSTRLAETGRGAREAQRFTKGVAAARSYPGRSRGRPDTSPTPLAPWWCRWGGHSEAMLGTSAPATSWLSGPAGRRSSLMSVVGSP